VAEGQAQRRHGNHAPDLGALKCQILPDGPPEGMKANPTKPVVAAFRRTGLGKIRKTLLSLNSFQTSGNSPGPARCLVGTLGSALARPLTGPEPIPCLELTVKTLHHLAEAA
jgi:hypothetical protein